MREAEEQGIAGRTHIWRKISIGAITPRKLQITPLGITTQQLRSAGIGAEKK